MKIPVLIASLFACLSTPAHAIFFGTETGGFEHTGCFVRSDDCGYWGSGTLVAPNWVLTAAHVNVESGSLFSSALGSATVKQVHEHPSWRFWDLELVELESSIDAGFYPTLSSQSLLAGFNGTWVVSVGYGDDEHFVPGTLRFGQSEIIPYDPSVSEPRLVDTSFMSSPVILGNGDSGGGTYVDFGAGYVLAGVNARVTMDGSPSVPGSGTGNVFVDVAGARAWLDSIAGSSLTWGTAAQRPAAAVPEPSTTMLALLGLVWMALSRRRQALPCPGGQTAWPKRSCASTMPAASRPLRTAASSVAG